jgi:hypothetical protein
MPNSELHILMEREHDVDMSPNEEWVAKNAELANLLIDFMARHPGEH